MFYSKVNLGDDICFCFIKRNIIKVNFNSFVCIEICNYYFLYFVSRFDEVYVLDMRCEVVKFSSFKNCF